MKTYTIRAFKLSNFADFDFFSNTQMKRDKLFILGSGSSINKLDKHQWKEISSNTSFGLNGWLIHDFVPTFYSFEPPRDLKERDKIIDIFFKKQIEYKNTTIILKDLFVRDLNFSKLPPLNFQIPIDFSVPAENIRQLEKGLRLISKMNRMKIFKNKFIYKKRASISMLVILGWQLGFKDIILCGVDLNNSKYFYEENSDYYQNKGIVIPENKEKKNRVHKTIDKDFGNLTIDQVIYSINKILLKPNNIRLYTAFSDSALNEELDTYFKE